MCLYKFTITIPYNSLHTWKSRPAPVQLHVVMPVCVWKAWPPQCQHSEEALYGMKWLALQARQSWKAPAPSMGCMVPGGHGVGRELFIGQ